MTREKSKIHHALDSCGIEISSVLSDIFGKAVLKGLLKGGNSL